MSQFTGKVAVVAGASINKAGTDGNSAYSNHHFLQLCLSPFISGAMLLGLLVVMLSRPRGAWVLIKQWVSTLGFQP